MYSMSVCVCVWCAQTYRLSVDLIYLTTFVLYIEKSLGETLRLFFLIHSELTWQSFCLNLSYMQAATPCSDACCYLSLRNGLCLVQCPRNSEIKNKPLCAVQQHTPTQHLWNRSCFGRKSLVLCSPSSHSSSLYRVFGAVGSRQPGTWSVHPFALTLQFSTK